MDPTIEKHKENLRILSDAAVTGFWVDMIVFLMHYMYDRSCRILAFSLLQCSGGCLVDISRQLLLLHGMCKGVIFISSNVAYASSPLSLTVPLTTVLYQLSCV